MGRIWMPGGGGGADLDIITAGAGDVLAGKVIVDKEGEPVAGTMPDRGVRVHGTDNGVNEDGIWTRIPYGYYRDGNREDSWVYRSLDEMRDAFKNAYGVGSVSGFNVSSSDDPSAWGRATVSLTGLATGNSKPWRGCSVYVDDGWKGNIEGNANGSLTINDLSEGNHKFNVLNYYTCNSNLDGSGHVNGNWVGDKYCQVWRRKNLSYSPLAQHYVPSRENHYNGPYYYYDTNLPAIAVGRTLNVEVHGTFNRPANISNAIKIDSVQALVRVSSSLLKGVNILNKTDYVWFDGNSGTVTLSAPLKSVDNAEYVSISFRGMSDGESEGSYFTWAELRSAWVT